MKIVSQTVLLAIGAFVGSSSIERVNAADCTDTLSGQDIVITAETPKAIEPSSTDKSSCAGTGQHVYLTALTVVPRSPTTAENLEITFKSGAGSDEKTVVATATTCSTQFANVGKNETIEGHVSASVKCKLSSCSVRYEATFECFKPSAYFVAGLTDKFRRIKDNGDAACKSQDGCTEICSKAYSSSVETTNLKLTSLVKSPNCDCRTPVTAVIGPDGVTAGTAPMVITYVNGVLTVDQTSSNSGCKSTYTKGDYNPFSSKTYARGDLTGTGCSASTDCVFKCNKVLKLTTENDKIIGQSDKVDGCDACPNVTATVGDDQTAVGAVGSGSESIAYTWTSKAGGEFELKTVKNALSCTGTYKVSNNPSTTPSPTSGVSINTVWAVAATALVAVAGAFTMM